MAVVLDSDAVVGFLDRKDPFHDAAAEVLTGARLGHPDEERVRGFFAQLISEILPVDMTVADKAAEFRSRLKPLRMPDALILATAETNPDVDLIVTGDAQASKVRGLDCAIRLLR